MDRSPEYWTGWAVAFYEWNSNIPFERINEYVSIDEIRDMYDPYHEADITRFTEEIDHRIERRHKESRLARLRMPMFYCHLYFLIRISSYRTFRKGNGMDKKIMRLNDDDIENVNGGTLEESGELVQRLKQLNTSELLNTLENRYGIKAILSSNEGNIYKDIETGKEISHKEVRDRIGWVKGPFQIPK